MEVKLLPHANKVEIEFRLLQNCVGTFIFWCFLPVLPHEEVSNKFSSALPTDPSWPAFLLLPALLFVCTFKWHQHLFSVHIQLNSSGFFSSFLSLVFAPLFPHPVYFHASKLPCFWDYANRNINHQALSLRLLLLWSSTYSFSGSKPQRPRKQISHFTFNTWS